MRCDICEQDGVELTHMDEVHGEGDDMYVIHNIPVYSCPHCHQEYLDSATIDELERIEANHAALAAQKYIGLIEFAPTAKEMLAASA